MKSKLLLINLIIIISVLGFLAGCGPDPNNHTWDEQEFDTNFNIQAKLDDQLDTLSKNLITHKKYILGYDEEIIKKSGIQKKQEAALYFILGLKKLADNSYALILLAPDLVDDPQDFLFAQGPEPKIPTEQLQDSKTKKNLDNLGFPVFTKLGNYQEYELLKQEDRVIAKSKFYSKANKLLEDLVNISSPKPAPPPSIAFPVIKKPETVAKPAIPKAPPASKKPKGQNLLEQIAQGVKLKPTDKPDKPKKPTGSKLTQALLDKIAQIQEENNQDNKNNNGNDNDNNNDWE